MLDEMHCNAQNSEGGGQEVWRIEGGRGKGGGGRGARIGISKVAGTEDRGKFAALHNILCRNRT